MSVERFLKLQREHLAQRETPDYTENDEDRFVDELEYLWWQLTNEEQDLINLIFAQECGALPDGTLPLVDVAVEVGQRSFPRKYGILSWKCPP